MARVRRVIKTVEPHDSAQRYTELGVEVIHGSARITSPWTVEVNGQIHDHARDCHRYRLAPGHPSIRAWSRCATIHPTPSGRLTERPKRLVVLGGGPIGCELAQAFALLDCQVTLVAKTVCWCEKMPMLLR